MKDRVQPPNCSESVMLAFCFFLRIKSYRVRGSNRKGKEEEMIISKQGV